MCGLIASSGSKEYCIRMFEEGIYTKENVLYKAIEYIYHRL